MRSICVIVVNNSPFVAKMTQNEISLQSFKRRTNDKELRGDK